MRDLVNSSLLIIAAIVFTSCDPADGHVEEERSDNLFCVHMTFEPDSTANLYYENDKLFSVIHYYRGQRYGKAVFYHENGQVQSERNYCGDRLHGLHRTFFEDGSLNSSGYYWKGNMTGKWTYYWPNGNIREQIVFDENREHGPFEEFYEDGTLKARGLYFEGDFEHGFLELFNEDGTLKRKMLCNKGICSTIST
jgi:antitoxin component YwqK of YwqJK toxin-antitoxin module